MRARPLAAREMEVEALDLKEELDRLERELTPGRAE